MRVLLDPIQEMPSPYCYAPLHATAREIRLAELLPADLVEDALYLRIHRVTLPPALVFEDSASPCLKQELQKTVPNDWIVRETLQGRIIFERQKSYGPVEPYETSWTHPDTGAEPPICRACVPRMIPFSPEYEALSHVWGPRNGGAEVWIRNALPQAAEFDEQAESTWSTMTVTEDLATALRHLRGTTAPRMLWVDMICINQQNIAERGHQVKLMGDIFRRAARVVAWLGPESSNSSRALVALDEFASQVELVENGRWRVNAPECANPTWSRTTVPLPFRQADMEAILDMVSRPWFNRLWVWQEAKLGSGKSIVKCGRQEILLQAFGKAIWCTAVKASTQSFESQTLLFNAVDVTVPRLVEPFLVTLLDLNRKECLDPRDRVYGALGWVSETPLKDIRVDYSRAPSDIYREAGLTLVGISGRIDFLVACGLSEQRATAYPTWVPDLSVPRGRPARWQNTSFHASDASTSGLSICNYDTHKAIDALGVRVGEVSQVGSRAPDDSEALIAALREWCQIGCCSDREDPEGQASFVRAVHWGFLRDRFPIDYSLPNSSEASQGL